MSNSQTTAVDTTAEGTVPGIPSIRSRPLLMIAVLMLSDALVLFITGLVCVYTRWHFSHLFEPSFYLRLVPFIAVFLLLYEFSGLYQGAAFYPSVANGPAEEMRRLTKATTVVWLAMAAITFLSRGAIHYSRLIFFASWMLTLVTVPLSRAMVRRFFSHRSWWGYPVVILGACDTGRKVTQALHRNPWLGLKPMAVLDPDPAGLNQVEGIPVVGDFSWLQRLRSRHGIRYAIIATSKLNTEEFRDLIRTCTDIFPHILVIPETFGIGSVGVETKDIGGHLGLELRQRLLLRGPRLVKRTIDLFLVALAFPVVAPISAFLAILIKLESRGPAFFSHVRLGFGGKPFNVWKFRTMVRDADQVLSDHLADHPEARREWKETRKLKKDPRITRFGRILRRTSLDELPQLWNVARGEMSIVGLRPIVHDEIEYYGSDWELYKRTRPGITGMWQVSGRSDVSFEERVALDVYYVHNWSVWLDLYIIARTPSAVIGGRGAH